MEVDNIANEVAASNGNCDGRRVTSSNESTSSRNDARSLFQRKVDVTDIGKEPSQI